MTLLSILFVVIFGCHISRHITAQQEFDVMWNFNDVFDPYKSGWANGTAAVIDLTAAVAGGELRCSITGYHPTLDSPSLFLNVTNRHFVVMRAKYSGKATEGRLLLRSGVTVSPPQQIVATTQYWSSRMKIIPLLSTTTTASDSAHSAKNLFDDDPYSIYVTNSSTLTQVIMDLQSYRWIISMRMLPIGGIDSPRRCLLMVSTTNGVGPFKTVSSFTLASNSSFGEQTISGFSGYARYWKLLVLDNYGGSQTGIRSLYLDGYDEQVTLVPFTWNNTNIYTIYYLPINTYLTGTLLRMRFELIYPTDSSGYAGPKVFNENLAIDYIHVVRAPLFWKVRGCLDKYYSTANYLDPTYIVTSKVEFINNHLPIYFFTKNNLTLQYATTYDCPLAGGVTITIEGENFGIAPNVFVGETACPVTQNLYNINNGRIQEIHCTLPPSTTSGLKNIRVENGLHPDLFFALPGVSYHSAPPVPDRPIVTNIAERKVDLVWSSPGSSFDSMTVTGYKIIWFQPAFPDFVSNLTVGNVTTTSVRQLQPATEYVFAIAAVAEGHTAANLPTDLYGRRELLATALIGEFSLFTNVTGTLADDFSFNFFNANQTLNNSAKIVGIDGSNGPTGQFGSEGSYGLVLVGSANIANCNASSTCCDGYNASIGATSCASGYSSVCAVLLANSLAYDYVLDGLSRRGIPTNLPYANGAPAVISFLTLDELIQNKGAALPDTACGPAARITPSAARSSGAMWYRRKMNVFEGFDTTIKFEISNPSQKCDRMDDVNTFCRSRGSDGWAFVIQNVAPDALGNAGSGLGYEGIFNSLAVEIDTYHNFDNMDYYENHVAVMTQGFRYNISANHSFSLATSNKVPDLTDGSHTVRIKYDPNFNPDDANHPSFQTSGFTTWFLNNADFANGGQGDWGTGFGLLYVYVDDLYSPVITTPLNLGSTLNLDDGRAYVGITAATGLNHWQVHDILTWKFSSLYEDINYTPPLIINSQGAFTCVDDIACVHQVNYENYMRKNYNWGPNFDDVESWMDGSQGFCEFC